MAAVGAGHTEGGTVCVCVCLCVSVRLCVCVSTLRIWNPFVLICVFCKGKRYGTLDWPNTAFGSSRPALVRARTFFLTTGAHSTNGAVP